MQQPADKSIRTGKYFAPMMQQKGDIRLLATPDALPMDGRCVLTWPHGTQLLGYVLFENGRITLPCKTPISKEIPKKATSLFTLKIRGSCNRPC